MYTAAFSQPWTFPFCPSQAPWTVPWQELEARFDWLQAMAGVPQQPEYHAEGDVLIHTRMVTEAMLHLQPWHALTPEQRTLLFASALFHDVGKPACTRRDETGRITSRGHARKGEAMTRRILSMDTAFTSLPNLYAREYLTRLVRYHGLPLQFLNHAQPERALFEASQSVSLAHLALLAEADVRGRICADQAELLARVELFREFAQELDCYHQPRDFTTAHSRFYYFQHEQSNHDYVAYDDTAFEVVMLAGLPGAGKDTWLHQNLADWPVVALDEIRRELKVTAEEDQGHVIQLARERARALMRQQRSFVWNATNITRMLRRPLIDLFSSYGGRVRLVYLETSFAELLQRNHERQHKVPEHVLYRLLNKLEVPDPTEAQKVEWYQTSIH